MRRPIVETSTPGAKNGPFPRIEQGQHVQLLEIGGGLDLPYEPLGPEHGSKFGTLPPKAGLFSC